MAYRKTFSLDNNIITQAELFNIDKYKIADNIDIYNYNVLEDTLNITNINDIKVMWDTGADISCINKQLAVKYNLPIIGRMKLKMANDNGVRCDRVLAALKLNDIMGYSIPLASFDFDSDYDLIIGLDIIKQGKLIIDYTSNIPLLEFTCQSHTKTQCFGNIISIIKK